MKFEEYEKLMLSEWRQNVLAKANCESSLFDKLHTIKENLYDFFYPLGITSNNMHAITEVCNEINYAMEDDGELSIVIAYTDRSEEEKAFHLNLLRKIKPDYQPKETTDDDLFVDFFVVHGHPSDLTEVHIKKIALQHTHSRSFVKFIAKSFSYKVLDFIYGLNGRFITTRELGQQCDKAANKTLLNPSRLDTMKEYSAYRKETDKMLIDFILSLEH